MLYAWEDLPRNDIAEIMGMADSAVRPENPPFLPETGSGPRAPHQTKPFPSDRRGRSDMTHEQIDRMVRKANPSATIQTRSDLWMCLSSRPLWRGGWTCKLTIER